MADKPLHTLWDRTKARTFPLTVDMTILEEQDGVGLEPRIEPLACFEHTEYSISIVHHKDAGIAIVFRDYLRDGDIVELYEISFPNLVPRFRAARAEYYASSPYFTDP